MRRRGRARPDRARRALTLAPLLGRAKHECKRGDHCGRAKDPVHRSLHFLLLESGPPTLCDDSRGRINRPERPGLKRHLSRADERLVLLLGAIALLTAPVPLLGGRLSALL